MIFLEWQYLLFELPLVFAVLYVLALASGVGHDGDGGHDMDHDVDGELAHEAETSDAHSPLDSVGHALEHDFDHDHDGEGSGHSTFQGMLASLGVGRVPLSFILVSFSFVWGVTGIAANSVLAPLLRLPWLYGAISTVLAFFSTIFIGGAAARTAARWMPTKSTFVSSERDFLGQSATAEYEITSRSGMVMLRDRHGNIVQLQCRVPVGEPVIARGTRVSLERYNPQERVFHVLPRSSENYRQLLGGEESK